MDKQSSPKSSLFDGWNAPPNLVTYSRIVLVVFFLTLDILAGAWGENNLTMRWVAAVLFIIAASTDKIDGWMARKYNQVTEMGKLMDPIADKLLTCGAMIVCSAFGELGWWVTILFLIREIGITGYAFLRHGASGRQSHRRRMARQAQDRIPVRGSVHAAAAVLVSG